MARSRSARRLTFAALVAVLALVVAFASSIPRDEAEAEREKHTLPGTFVNPTDLPARAGVAAPAGLATRLGFCGGDDWEPEIAHDDLGHVYAVITHYPGNPICDPASANQNRIYIQVSNDGGSTFGPQTVVADAVGGVFYPEQADPVVAVDPVTREVYVSFLAGDDSLSVTAVARSTDFGATFTAAEVSSACVFCDHPWTVASGGNVYTMYAANAGAHYLSRSADGGITWSETLVAKLDAVEFPEGGVVDAAGNAYFAWTDCKSASCRGNKTARYLVSKTLAGTGATTFTLVATGPAGPICPYYPNCGFSFFGVQNDIAIDAAGSLYIVWQDGQDHGVGGSPPIVQLSRSSDGGVTWTQVGRVDDKSARGCANSKCYALFPRIEGGAANRITVMWMDDRLGAPLDHENGWNVWIRSSATGGNSWTGPSQRVSQYDPTRKESRPNGYLFPYGDYEGLALLPGPSAGALLVWGEGVNYTGGPSNPGHIIFRFVST